MIFTSDINASYLMVSYSVTQPRGVKIFAMAAKRMLMCNYRGPFMKIKVNFLASYFNRNFGT
jgi:hypothetical protein